MKNICITILLGLLLTSCNSMLQGMAAGMRGYGYGYTPAVGYGNSNNMASKYYNSINYGAIFSSPTPTTTPATSGGSTSSKSKSSGTTTSSSSGSSSGNFCRTCSNTRKCYVCHGSGKRTDNYYGTGSDPTVKCGVCGGTGRCTSCQ